MPQPNDPTPQKTSPWGGLADLLNPGVTTVRMNFLGTSTGPDEMPEELKSSTRYETGPTIGHGGMGVVMSAQQPAIRRQVAMKVMLGAEDTNSRLRFIEEAQITGQLQHPNIVPVHDLALDEHGRPFYTMKLVKGITLQRVIDGLAAQERDIIAAYPLATLLTIFQKVCDALAFAHSRGVIHRDLKPANIMLGDYGEVLVMDWGLARVIGTMEKEHSTPESETVPVTSARRDLSYCYGTLNGLLLGTPQYMSPEQSRGETDTLDARSDIFSLGAILHQMLTLQPAFEGPDTEAILEHIRTGKTVPPHEVSTQKTLPHCPNGLVPHSLSAVVMKALQLERENRYPSVEALQKDIAAYQGGFATSAEEAGWWRQFTLFLQRHRALSIAVVASVLLLIAVSASFTTKVLGERNRAEQALGDLRRTAPRLIALAQSEALAQHFESALEKTEAALALDPSLVAGYWSRVWGLIAMDRFREAIPALRQAIQKDPSQQSYASLLPLLENLVRHGKAPFKQQDITPLMEFLESVGARGEALSLTRHLRLGADERFTLVQKRLVELGVTTDGVAVSAGVITLNVNRSPVTSLEHLRGLPIDALYMDGRREWDATALQGMKLIIIRAKNSGIRDLTPLRGMTLTRLDIEGTDTSELSPLSAMPLRLLDLTKTRVFDLTPLRGLPLEELHVDATPLARLEGLDKMPLKRLDITATRITSLSPLAKSRQLQELYANNTSISDLRGIEGLPLRSLHLMSSPVSDLSPLQKMPLETLNLARTLVSDLTPLAEVPLRQLNVQQCRQLKDFRPLLKMTSLERLATSAPLSQLAPLRQHPRLSHIDYNDQGYRPVTEVWALLEARKKKP